MSGSLSIVGVALRALHAIARSEQATFLAVGGVGYLVDVGAFNALRLVPPTSTWSPAWWKVLAVAAAMVVTYVGNKRLTWRGAGRHGRVREIFLFVVFNLLGLATSVVALLVSRHLGLTSALADNISANVVGLGLGTLLRFWSYRHFVFVGAPSEERKHRESASA